MFSQAKLEQRCAEMKARMQKLNKDPEVRKHDRELYKAWLLSHPKSKRRSSEQSPKAAVNSVLFEIEHPYYFMAHSANTAAKKYGDPARISEEDVARLMNHYGDRCLACGTAEKVGIDHCVPFSILPINQYWNLQPLCGKCNSKKGARIKNYRLAFDQGTLPWQMEEKAA